MVIENDSGHMLASISASWRQMDEHGVPDPLLDLIAERFRLLGEPLRLKLLAALSSGEKNVGELVEITDAGQANVSKHLGVLTQGGLINRRKVGTSIYYAIADQSTFMLCDVVCAGIQKRFSAQVVSLGLESQLEAKTKPLLAIKEFE